MSIVGHVPEDNEDIVFEALQYEQLLLRTHEVMQRDANGWRRLTGGDIDDYDGSTAARYFAACDAAAEAAAAKA